MFPTKKEALEKAKERIPPDCKIVGITDDWSSLNVFNIPLGCWYFIYVRNDSDNLQSSFYLAISKVDNTIVAQGSLNDEG